MSTNSRPEPFSRRRGQQPGAFASPPPMPPVAAWWVPFGPDFDHSDMTWTRRGVVLINGEPSVVALLQLVSPQTAAWDEYIPVRTPHRDGRPFGTRAWYPTSGIPTSEDLWIFLDEWGLVHLDRELEVPTNLALLSLVAPIGTPRRDEDDDL